MWRVLYFRWKGDYRAWAGMANTREFDIILEECSTLGGVSLS